MSSAHRPTFHPAKGGGNMMVSQGGYFTGGHMTGSMHPRDMPAHTKLKYRQYGQSSADEVRARDLRALLEAKEREHFDRVRKERERTHAGSALEEAGETAGMGHGAVLAIEGDASSVAERSVASARTGASVAASATSRGAALTHTHTQSSAPKEEEEDAILAAFDDADDDVLERKGLVGEESEEDEEEDDTAELMRELERIKREREEERQRKEREASELAERDTTEAILRGNPLLTKGLSSALGSSGASSSQAGFVAGAVKRRFGDDTVFSHTHSNEPEVRKRFINDMIRSDFHRSFLRKFVV